MASQATAVLKVALVSTFPPSKGDLNEYGLHLAEALRQAEAVCLVVIADEVSEKSETEGSDIVRVWRFNGMGTALRILRALRREKPDVVWFNMGFSTFAEIPLAAFLSMVTPLLARAAGFYTHITLHTVFERISLNDAGIGSVALYRLAGSVATRLLFCAHDLTVLLPSFRNLLVEKYRVGAGHVHCRPHGAFPERVSRAGAPIEQREPLVLVFGYWGTYKKLEIVLAAMEEVLKAFPDARLEVAGGDHPSTPGYLETVQAKFGSGNSIRFLGYVPEDEVSEVFGRARLLVLPYTSAAGTSGVMHQACQHGLPLIASDIDEFFEIAREGELAVDFYPCGDSKALASRIGRLLAAPEVCREMSARNLRAAEKTPISTVVDEYLELFRVRRITKGQRFGSKLASCDRPDR